ncbi:CAP domain-containing protein [Streptomyces sp. NPDC056254]|uniref:CAP domain-containing protein n=1 Tax=Streptomyces sp. NPDC056254 TaxID=3345763 RepID=UPI0035E078F2
MKLRYKPLFVIILLLNVSSVATAAGTSTDHFATSAEVVALTNQARASAGCSALRINEKLTAVAVDHSHDMAVHSTMSHRGSDGSDSALRVTRAKYDWIAYGENVAYGYSTGQQVVDAWMNSPGHRKNILDCSFKEIGVGHAQPGNYWTQMFGSPR